MNVARKKTTKSKKNGSKSPRQASHPTKEAIRAELYKPENIEKARRLDRGTLI